MKGLIISLVIFAAYVLSTAFFSHILKPKKYSRVFFPLLAAWTPVYFAAYFLTPADLYFLPESWIAGIRWLDVTYGYIVFVLNFHSFLDFFFGFNGGFSMTIMHLILQSPRGELAANDVAAAFTTADGLDKIYSWRVPKLEKTGMLTFDPERRVYRVTEAGRRVAKFTIFCKRFLNLGLGG